MMSEHGLASAMMEEFQCSEAILEMFEEGLLQTEDDMARAYDAYLTFFIAGLAPVQEMTPILTRFLEEGQRAYDDVMARVGAPIPRVVLLARRMLGAGARRRPHTPELRTPDIVEHPFTNPDASDAGELSASDVGEASPAGEPDPDAEPSRAVTEPNAEQLDPSRAEPSRGEPEIHVVETRQRYLARFKTTFREEVMQVEGLNGHIDSESMMVSLFDTILERQREAVRANPEDMCLLELESDGNANKRVWFSLRRTDQLDGKVVIDKLSRVLNSNQSFIVDAKLKVMYIHVPVPKPGGKSDPVQPNLSFTSWLQKMINKKSVIDPENHNDRMCLARSIVIAGAHGQISKFAFSRLKKNTSVNQAKLALEICRKAKLKVTQPCGLDEIKKMQEVLPEYRLCVYTDRRGKECVYKGPYEKERKPVHLLWHAEHFYAVLYPLMAFNQNFMCPVCITYFSTKGSHRCEGGCNRCCGPVKHGDVPLIRCQECMNFFAGEDCLKRHKTEKLFKSRFTKCESVTYCSLCQTTYSNASRHPHLCGSIYCKFCQSTVGENHLCYMQKWQEKELKENVKYLTITFDIETTQCDPVDKKPETWTQHRPNLLVCQVACQLCENSKDLYCTVCGAKQSIFHSFENPKGNVVGQFLNYLHSFEDKKDKYELLIVSHNGKSFDMILIVNEMVKREMKPHFVMQGAKVMSMSHGNWKFIDSLMFLPMPLSAMPKSFGLTELKKGYFPFLFNKPDNYNYVGPLPAKEYYCISQMKEKAAIEFNQWYDDQVAQNYVYNHKQEAIAYCISDVQILREGCQAFRKLFTEIAGFDPMFNCLTLSSACMAAYRRNFMPEDKIGIVPEGGYRGRDKQSFIALKWLDYVQHQTGQKIQTAESGLELSVFGRKVDGYFEREKEDGTKEKFIYQFHGCFFHGCPTCFPERTRAIYGVGGTMANRFEMTTRLTRLYRERGYQVTEMWEHEFNDLLKTDEEMIQYFETHPTQRSSPLQLRDAICGGRTSALRSYAKADISKGVVIKLADVISEYPSVLLFDRMVTGHPTIYLENDPHMPDLKVWNGVAKLTVLPPRDLFLPVLPYKCNNRLMFPLCRSCVESCQETNCHHFDPVDRVITGTWCAPEIQLAVLEKGYQVVKIHEVYQYPGSMQFNPQTGEDGLFSGYVRCFMALKIQASGWPANCDTEEKKQQFVEDVRVHDGVTIDPAKMQHNPAMRTLAKLILNSFWGKFAERTIRSKTELVYDYGQLMEIINDSAKIVTSMLPLSDNCVQIQWKPSDEKECSLPTSSLIHGAFTTCLGRLKLYSYLDMVKERAIYHDTDSVGYLSVPGKPDLPLGSHLGELTDQIFEDYGKDCYIEEMVCGGPKNYSYAVRTPQDVKYSVKVRGISINNSCKDKVTFENLKEMVLENADPLNISIDRQIARLPGWKIVTRPAVKTWKAVNVKRRRVDREHTVPHGFCTLELTDDDYEMADVLDELVDM